MEGDFGTRDLRGVDEALPRLLDALDARGARATLFVVGEVARARPGALREAARRGHVDHEVLRADDEAARRLDAAAQRGR